jgi:hypothetical protein
MELDEFGLPVWDFPLPLYAPNDPIAYDQVDDHEYSCEFWGDE